MKTLSKLLLVGVMLLLFSFLPTKSNAGACISTDGTKAFAANSLAECESSCASEGVTCTYMSEVIGSTSQPGGPTSLDCPLGDPTRCSDPRIIIGQIIRVVLGIVGSLALIIFIYGGLTWMTSSGNTERIKRGRDTLVWAAIGLMVIFGSYTVVNFVIQSLTKP